MENTTEFTVENTGTKKRKVSGRMVDVRKKLNLMTHVLGENCECRLKCFEVVPDSVKKSILQQFNLMGSKDEQDSYLSGMISVLPVARRRNRKPAEQARTNSATFKYRIRGKNENNQTVEYDVCKKALCAIHGIGKKRLERICTSLANTGFSPKSRQGKHDARPHKIKVEVLDLIRNHIRSFPSRNNHYGLKDSKRIYLQQDLNVKKMYELFIKQNQDVKVSYDYYRKIFLTEFNISFGYPRVDTCSTCDEFNSKVKSLEIESKNCSIDRKI